MRVLLLGGTGVFGQDAAGLLADSNLVTKIAIASRRPEAAQRVACTLRILGGQVDQRGVLPPEACFDPQAFFADVVKVRPPTSEGPLLGESLRYLD